MHQELVPWCVQRKERLVHMAVSAFIECAGAIRLRRRASGPRLAPPSGQRDSPMSENKYRVVFEGSLLIEGSEHEARQLLSALFRRHPDDVGQLLDGRARVVANKVTRAKAEEYLALLRRAGIAGRVLRADET
jgi:hypothetical protein